MTFNNIPSVRNKIKNIYIDGTQVGTVSHTQLLGMIIENKINWNELIKYTCKRYLRVSFSGKSRTKNKKL